MKLLITITILAMSIVSCGTESKDKDSGTDEPNPEVTETTDKSVPVKEKTKKPKDDAENISVKTDPSVDIPKDNVAGTPDNSVESEAPVEQLLQGEWLSRCTLGDDGASYQIKKSYSNGAFKWRNIFYLGSSCDNVKFEITKYGKYYLHNDSTVENAVRLSYEYTRGEFANMVASEIELSNQAQLCGISNWQLGVSQIIDPSNECFIGAVMEDFLSQNPEGSVIIRNDSSDHLSYFDRNRFQTSIIFDQL